MKRGRLALALLLVCGAAEAQQLDFQRTSRGGDETLVFRWRDLHQREHATALTVAQRDIQQAEASFREFSLDGMWRYIEASMRDEAARFGNGVAVEITWMADRLGWAVSGGDSSAQHALMRRLQERFDRAQKEYLANHLRRRGDEGRIMVDFAAAARAFQEPMRDVAKALQGVPGAAGDDRARVALALAFFQQIPYRSLGDGRRANDFLPGPALLAQNRGDCDSKAVALAAVLRTFVPTRKLAVVTMPGHAVLGVDLPALPGEQTVQAEARQYVLLEPAGPRLSPIGNADPRTAKYLAQAREIEIWPLN